MVSTVQPGAVGAGNTLGVEARLQRNTAPTPRAADPSARGGDSVQISGASLAAARESVRDALSQVQAAMALGRDAQGLLVNIQSLISEGAGQEKLDDALVAFSGRVDAALSQGVRLVAGEDIVVNAEPGAAPTVAHGVDLRLRAAPTAADVFQVSSEALIVDPGLAQAAQVSMDKLQAAMTKLADVARALDAHQGFIGAAVSAVAGSIRHDLDADGARLLALQVKQGLESSGGRSIANAEPQAVLSLFRVTV